MHAPAKCKIRRLSFCRPCVRPAHASASATRELQPTPSKAGLVLLTREAGKNGALKKALAKKGIQSRELPLVTTTSAADTCELKRTLQKSQFTWVVLTSPEAARVFVTEGWRKLEHRAEVSIAVVGEGTARVLEGLDETLKVSFTPSIANAAALAAELPLKAALHGHKEGKPTVLYPASARAQTTLQAGLAARGFEVTRLDTYNTVPVEQVPRDVVQEALECSVVTVAAPSALKAWVNIVGSEVAMEGVVACIGSTSGRAALRLGYSKEQVFWEEVPGMDGFVRSVEAALQYRCSLQPSSA